MPVASCPVVAAMGTDIIVLPSRVSGGQSPTPTGQQALDVDSYLDPSVLDSSLLTLSGLTEVTAPPGTQGRLSWLALAGLSSLRLQSTDHTSSF